LTRGVTKHRRRGKEFVCRGGNREGKEKPAKRGKGERKPTTPDLGEKSWTIEGGKRLSGKTRQKNTRSKRKPVGNMESG